MFILFKLNPFFYQLATQCCTKQCSQLIYAACIALNSVHIVKQTVHCMTCLLAVLLSDSRLMEMIPICGLNMPLAGRWSAGVASMTQTCLRRPVGALWGEDAASTAQSGTRVLPTHLSWAHDLINLFVWFFAGLITYLWWLFFSICILFMFGFNLPKAGMRISPFFPCLSCYFFVHIQVV
jgi:hypothetical protein